MARFIERITVDIERLDRIIERITVGIERLARSIERIIKAKIPNAGKFTDLIGVVLKVYI